MGRQQNAVALFSGFILLIFGLIGFFVDIILVLTVSTTMAFMYFLTGFFGIASSYYDRGANFNIFSGGFYITLAAIGYALPIISNALNIYNGNHWFHLFIGILLLFAGLLAPE